MGRKEGGRFKRERTYVYLWLIHVDVWRKTTQYCNYPPIKNKIKKFLMKKKNMLTKYTLNTDVYMGEMCELEHA